MSGLHSILTSRVVRFGLLALTPFLLCIEGWLQWSSHASLAKPLKVKRASDPARLSMQQLYDSLVAGRTDLVEARLVQLQGELPDDIEDWNYGNVQHQFMILSGLLALYKDNDVERAKGYLALAGQTKGSPQLNSYGPDMLLARALLERGEFEAVDFYFEQCKTFWTMGIDLLNAWSAEVRSGRIPNFES